MKWFTPKSPFQHVIDFIDATSESEELCGWLEKLEREPENMRHIRLAEIRTRMVHDSAPSDHIDIIDLMGNAEILAAMNQVIQEVREAGVSLARLNRKKQCASFQALVSLLPTP
jgi:hypothetical protein